MTLLSEEDLAIYEVKKAIDRHISARNYLVATELISTIAHKKQFLICKQLLDNLDNHYVDESLMSTVYVRLLFNYCDAIIELGLYADVIANATKGWRLAVAHQTYQYLKCFALTLANAFFHTGHSQKSLAYIALSYYLAKIEKSKLYMEIATTFAQDRLATDITK